MPITQLLHPHGELTANDVMVDYLDDNLRRLKRTLKDLPDECLNWKADEEANDIATILWHMGRLFDVFLTQLTQGLPSHQERWIMGGWSKDIGYDPRGLGRDGWGSVNQYTPEEVTEMPEFSLELLMNFIEDIYAAVRKYIQATSMEVFSQAAPGFDGQFTRYQVISMALMDNIRHLGEIRLIKLLWERGH